MEGNRSVETLVTHAQCKKSYLNITVHTHNYITHT